MSYFRSTQFAFILFIAVLLTSCENSDIQTVKAGMLKICPEKTIQQAVEAYIQEPTWSIDNKSSIVSVHGQTKQNGELVNSEIQFKLSQDKSSFTFSSWSTNGKQLDYIPSLVLFNKMCYADLERIATAFIDAEIEEDPKKVNSINILISQQTQENQTIINSFISQDPRLDFLTAKSKSTEIIFAFEEYLKLQNAFFDEKRELGTWLNIGYIESTSSNFLYHEILEGFTENGFNIAGIEATNIRPLEHCQPLSRWIIRCNSDKPSKYKCSCNIESDNIPACEKLTPTFKNLCNDKTL